MAVYLVGHGKSHCNDHHNHYAHGASLWKSLCGSALLRSLEGVLYVAKQDVVVAAGVATELVQPARA